MEGSRLSIFEVLVFIVACLSIGVATYTNTALMTAIPYLTKSFGLSPTAAQWSIDIFLVFSVSFIILAGKMADRYGVVKFYAAGLVVFLTGSLLVALSGSTFMLLLGRACEGVGFGFIMPLSLQLLKQAMPESFHSTATAVWAGMLSLGFGAGPTVGGFFVTYASWRGVFWVSALLMVICLAGLLVGIAKVRLNVPSCEKQGVHLFGFVTFTVAVIALIFFLIEVQKIGLFNIEMGFVLLLMMIAATAFYLTTKDHPTPYFNLNFFSQRDTVLSISGIFFTMFALFPTLYFYSAYLQSYYTTNLSAVAAGSALLLASLLIFFLSLVISKVSQKISERRMRTIGLLLATLGYLLLFLFSEVRALFWFQLVSLVFIGIGMGVSYPLFPGFGFRSVEAKDVGQLSGVISVASGLGCAIGVAFAGIIYHLYFYYSVAVGGRLIGSMSVEKMQAYLKAAHAVTADQVVPLLAKAPKETYLAVQYAVGSGFSHAMLLCALATIFRALIGILWPKEA